MFKKTIDFEALGVVVFVVFQLVLQCFCERTLVFHVFYKVLVRKHSFSISFTMFLSENIGFPKVLQGFY